MTDVLPQLNEPLLEAVLTQITEHPETHNQGAWRCGTSHCIGGWAATLAGRRWASGVAGDEFVIARDGDDPSEVINHLVHVSHAARDALGLTDEQAAALFCGANNRDDIARIIGDIRAGRDSACACAAAD